MARRFASKSRKYLGNRSHGAGNTKNRRGKGSKGGVGRAGYHKHKWLKTIKEGLNGSRRRGFTNRNATISSQISLAKLQMEIEAGKYKKEADGSYRIELTDTQRVLSQGDLTAKIAIKAGKFTAKAKEKIEKAGGKIIE